MARIEEVLFHWLALISFLFFSFHHSLIFSVALTMAKDDVLLDEAFHCLAYSQLRDDIADRWVGTLK
jgi:hypothetical protein